MFSPDIMMFFGEDLIQTLKEVLARTKSKGRAIIDSRAKGGDAASAIAFLQNAPDVEPEPGDRID